MAVGDEIVMVSAVRTPFGRYGGALKKIDYYDLGAIPMREVIKKVGLSPNLVGQVFWGVGDTTPCKDPCTPIAARQSLLKAGLPYETTSISFDMACVSGMHAVKLAAMAIRLGEIEVAIAGGATSFSRVPLLVRGLRFQGNRLGHIRMEDPLLALGYKDYSPMAVEIDNMAAKYKIERQEQDEWALRSHTNYGRAWDAGKFRNEIMSLTVTAEKGQSKVINIDEQYRGKVTLDELGALETIYGTKTITAGNAPGLNDGAAAILVMSRKRCQELELEPLAAIIAQTSIAIHPQCTPEGPGCAIRNVLRAADLNIDDIAVMEINEAFAAVVLVSTKFIAGDDAQKLKGIRDKTNINGSAIAIGHANTASGARVIMNLIFELRRRGGGYALGAIGGALGQADAIVIKTW